MPEQSETESARTPPPITSAELTDALAVQGHADLQEETVLNFEGGSARPALMRRIFQMTVEKVLHGADSADAGTSFTFEGYTTVPPAERSDDVRLPSVRLEGQAFFDRALPDGPLPIFLLIGGNPISAPGGFQGKTASVLDGSLNGQPVRAFLLAGADRSLPTALPSLAGWNLPLSLVIAMEATRAGHPLIALDALRLAARQPEGDIVLTLAAHLLHVAQPAPVRSIALELLATIASGFPPGSEAANALLRLSVETWRMERRYATEAGYLNLWIAAAPQALASDSAEAIRAMATDETTAQRLQALRTQAASSLSAGKSGK